MPEEKYDLIVIGCGSGGLSVGLFMGLAGFKVLMVSKSEHSIGGDCLNDGCVPSKSFIHVAKIAHQAKEAANFGLELSGNIDIQKAIGYVYQRQELIREHENADWLKKQGVDLALGEAHFTNKNEIEVSGKKYQGKKIVIATGSKPKKLLVPGVEKIRYYDNESIFHLNELPKNLLVIGGGPIGIEIAQALSRLGSKVTIVQKGDRILPNDEKETSSVLLLQLQKEGIELYFNASVDHFISSTEALINFKDGSKKNISFDAVFVGIGRDLNVNTLQPQLAGVELSNGKIVVDKYLRTSNKNIFVCGDIAGDLQFSHTAEANARLLLNNFFSPIKKKLNNDFISWVTFTDPELASFGLSEKQLIERGIGYEKLVTDFKEDDRAVTDNYQYGKSILFISKKSFLGKQRILGGSMVAPGAGELIQELILANGAKLSINALFNKIYPYPTASRINQQAIVKYKSAALTASIKSLLKPLYKIFS
ncbi:MAG: NAD(P)/FAD-dependent oxidoreductase [Bacteroidetes bacterium]|nr:NAD(P)/FAD-dependent oxidoreductase [Bacteroidota bacterium]